VFPIFPVDYPFIEKGHRFTTDANTQARSNGVWLVREFGRNLRVITGTAGVSPAMSAKRENKFEKATLTWRLQIVLTLLCLASFSFQVAAQQPTRAATKSLPKTSTIPQAKPANNFSPLAKLPTTRAVLRKRLETSIAQSRYRQINRATRQSQT
jgi:hypothetical protein